MHTFIFTKFAKKRFKQLDIALQDRILDKLKELKKHNHIFSVLKPLRDFSPATHRLRIGGYRMILQHKEDNIFLVLDVGHRKDIYR